jgi:hypothetical protein
MMRTARARQRFHGSFLKQCPDRAPLGLDVGQGQLGRTFTSNHDEIHPVRQELGAGAKALPAEPFDPVAAYGAPDTARDDDAQARRTRGRGLSRDQEREVRRADTAPGTLGDHELGVPSQPAVDARRKTGSAASLGLAQALLDGLLLVDRRHEALAALAAAALKNLPAAMRRHAGAEAVGACPADVVGLVSALHEGARKKAPAASPVKSGCTRTGQMRAKKVPAV